MSNLTRLDEAELNSFPKMTVDAGVRAKNALEAYGICLTNISGSSFGKKDTSTAHAVIDKLNSEIKTIADSMSEVDSMLDSILELIDHEIITKENNLAKELWSD